MNRLAWKFKHKESLIDSWEIGVDEQGNEITESEYSDFEDRMWREFDDSQADGSID